MSASIQATEAALTLGPPTARRGVALWRRHVDIALSVATAFAIQSTLVVSGVLVARVLGVENRGHFALLVLFPLILTQAGTLGLPLALTYYIARDKARASEIVATLLKPSLLLTLGLVCLQGALVALVLRSAPSAVQLAGLFTLPAVAGSVAQTFGLAVLQGQERFHVFNALRALQVVLYAAAMAAAFLAGSRSIVLVTALWSASVCGAGAVVLAMALSGLPRRRPVSGSLPGRGEMLRFGLKSLVGTLSPTESFRLDQLLVGMIAGPAQLGLYVIATAFTNLPRFVAQSIGMVAYPRVASRGPGGRGAVLGYVLLALLACGAIVAVLEALVGQAVPFFFGREFEAAVPITRVLLLSALLFSLRRVLSDCARGLGRPDLPAKAEVASWLVVLAAVPILAHHHGAIGVAWTLVAVPAVSSTLIVVQMLLQLENKPGRPSGADKLLPVEAVDG